MVNGTMLSIPTNCKSYLLTLPKGSEDFTVSGTEGISVNRATRDERSRDIPVAYDHADPGISFSAYHRDTFGKAFRIKFHHEPVTSLAQHSLPAQIEKLQI